MKFFTRFNRPKHPGLSFTVIDPKSGEITPLPSLTVQSEKDSCDINKIMERFNRTGQLPHMISRAPTYGDARVVDYQTAQQIVIDAQKQFNSLPSATRKHFGNDPQNFMSAISDAYENPSEEKTRKLLDLGILMEVKESSDQILSRIAKNTEKEEKSVQK